MREKRREATGVACIGVTSRVYEGVHRLTTFGNLDPYLRKKMAQLHRFVKLNDRFDTQVFTFILPGTLMQQTSPDVLSREFVYGNQKWRVSMMRNEKHLSAYLTLNNACEGLTCVMDFSFTMINSEHFTRNDMYIERGCKFTMDKSMHGRRTFIGISDLQNRGFLHFGRHFVVELEVRNARNIFEQVGLLYTYVHYALY